MAGVSATQPPCLAVACGAIGAFSRDRVRSLAASFERGLTVAHEGTGAILFTDRPPRRWTAAGRTGFSWGRALPPPGAAAGWQDAARDGDCGLVLDPDGPFLHSSTPGVYPLYWHADADAVYFASLVDPLARSAAQPLSVDWEAWAGTLTCGCPLGERTPFTEIRRLLPHARLHAVNGAPRASVEEWPWLAVEPRLTVEEGAGPLLEALRALVARLPERPMPFALSGGLDSRILACVVAERRLGVTAYTGDADSANDGERRAAAAVADALGLAHEEVPAGDEDYWLEAEERGLRTDFLRLANPWLNPVHRRIATWGVPVLDGLGGDITCDRSRYVTPEMVDPDRPGMANPLWRGMRHERAIPLAGSLGEQLTESVRQQVREMTRHLVGHPNRGIFGPYWTRMIGGVARVSMGNLGTQALVEAPFVTDEVATRTLAVDPRSKFTRSLRRAVITLVNPAVAAMPSNHDAAVNAKPVPQRRLSPMVLTGFEELVAEGPLGRYLDPSALSLVRGEGSRGGMRARRVWRSVDAVATYHLWLRRYGSIVRGADPADALGVAPP